MIKPTAALREKGPGFSKEIRNLRNGGRAVEVGILGPRAAEEHIGRDGMPSEATLADIAFFNHNGTATIEARPFISGWMETQRENIKAFCRELAKKRVTGELTEDQAMKRLAVFAKAGVQRYMRDGVFAPNAQSTIDRKGSSKPLKDTGQMQSAVDARETNGGRRGVVAS